MLKESAEWLKPFKRSFVDDDFKITDADSIKLWFDKLIEAEISSALDMKKWLSDYSELSSIVSEDYNRRYVAMTCDTKSEKKKEHFLSFVRDIQPKLSQWSNLADRKYYDSAHKNGLDKKVYGLLDKIFSTSIELFNEKNIPLDVELSELSQKYQTITGAWTVEFDGQVQTMPQMGKFMLKTDRAIRESAYKAMTTRRLEDAQKLESTFDKMVSIRDEYAKNLGLDNFRDYAFKSKLRDYSPNDCLEFHDAIENSAVPLVRKIAEKRKKEMNLNALRPWDMQVDAKGRNPLEPFKEVSELQDGVETIFNKIDRRLGERFKSIKEFMDLDSRDGKAQGGYQTTFEEKRIPFIFTNAAGLHNDVITLLHEGGHAFHTLECRDQQLQWYRHSGMEFAEVASMTQELFANPYLDVFYGDKEIADRARLEQLERTVDIFPWVATIDAFQHWIYTNPKHSQAERAEKWQEISGRFEVPLDWSGLDPNIKKYSWHRQLHLFEVPFYYIEYAIAQLGALQFYRIYKEDSQKAIDQYLTALKFGGSKPSGELFKTGGIEFNFSKEMLKSLVDMVEEEIERL